MKKGPGTRESQTHAYRAMLQSQGKTAGFVSPGICSAATTPSLTTERLGKPLQPQEDILAWLKLKNLLISFILSIYEIRMNYLVLRFIDRNTNNV